MAHKTSYTRRTTPYAAVSSESEDSSSDDETSGRPKSVSPIFFPLLPRNRCFWFSQASLSGYKGPGLGDPLGGKTAGFGRSARHGPGHRETMCVFFRGC